MKNIKEWTCIAGAVCAGVLATPLGFVYFVHHLALRFAADAAATMNKALDEDQ